MCHNVIKRIKTNPAGNIIQPTQLIKYGGYEYTVVNCNRGDGTMDKEPSVVDRRELLFNA